MSNLADFTTENISFEIVVSLYESEKRFPVNLDMAWQWLGYSTKASAKRKLVKYFEKDFDYEVFNQMVENSAGNGVQVFNQMVENPITSKSEASIILDKNSIGGRPESSIWLSANCLKEMAMMAGTAKGKEVRQHFLQCEEAAKQLFKFIPQMRNQLQSQQQQIDNLRQLFLQQQGQQKQIEELGQIALQHDNAIASLQQARVDIPPGWDIADWEALPPQDKKHFLNLWLKDQFNPKSNKEVRDYKREQRKELMEAIGSVGRIDQVRIAEAKTTLLAKFWAQGGQS
ncbi:MAG: hypothetical protein PUP93_31165 [Rhizonema sp. NSF051]|nr:hypothetical protein [Rhizonema sp. NSF051]